MNLLSFRKNRKLRRETTIVLKLDSIKTLAVLGMCCLQIQKLHTYSPGTLLKLGAHLLEWSIDNVSVFGG